MTKPQTTKPFLRDKLSLCGEALILIGFCALLGWLGWMLIMHPVP
jgi:hypothetical protein